MVALADGARAKASDCFKKCTALSGGYFGSTRTEPRGGGESRIEGSITIRAPSCVVADALTKAVVAADPKPELLRQFDAVAFLLATNGTLYAARA